MNVHSDTVSGRNAPHRPADDAATSDTAAPGVGSGTAMEPLCWARLRLQPATGRANTSMSGHLSRSILARARRLRPDHNKGAAVRMGMLAARGQICVMSDADGSMPPEQLPSLLAPIVACKAAIAIGSRYSPGTKTDIKQPKYRVLVVQPRHTCADRRA